MRTHIPMGRQRIRKQKTITINGTFDIETEKWTTYVLGGVKTHDGTLLFEHSRENELFDYLLNFEGVLWGHNAGSYDTLWFIDHLIKHKEKAEIFSAGPRITLLKVRKLELRDSYALVPLALKKAAEIGGIPKIATGLPCICRGANRANVLNHFKDCHIPPEHTKRLIGQMGCGGYCSIRRDMSETMMRDLRRYLEYDLNSLDKLLDRVKDYGDVNDLDVCGTIGSSSWNTAARAMSLPSANWHSRDGRSEGALYNFLRLGYFGGRTQLFWPEPPKDILGYRYDIISSYPAALKNLQLPWGPRREVVDAQAMAAFREGKEGIYEATVIVPSMHIPPLPVRCKDRIAYPLGRLHGVWPANELRYAETVGCTIVSFGRAIIWQSVYPVFKAYCDRIFKLRDNADTTSALGQFLKWFANSLTGKLAQDPTNEECRMGVPESELYCKQEYDCKDGAMCPKAGQQKCCLHHCDQHHFMSLSGNDNIAVRPLWRMPDCAHIHWAAYLTAHARIELHKMLIADGQGGKTAVYCDTDSCFSTTERFHNIGNALGNFKFEGYWWHFHSMAPKTYSYIDPGKWDDENGYFIESGEFVARSKGIPDANKNYHKLAEGVLIDRGVESLRVGARHSPIFRQKNMTRKVTGKCMPCRKANTVCPHKGDRILLIDGLTHPVDVKYLTLHGTESPRPQQSVPATQKKRINRQ
jgi:hypothetical protein